MQPFTMASDELKSSLVRDELRKTLGDINPAERGRGMAAGSAMASSSSSLKKSSH